MSFPGKRWMIVCGSYEGVEGLAVNELYKAIQQFVPYVLTVSGDDTDEALLAEHHVALVGTARSNRHIARLADAGALLPNAKKEGYLLKSCKSCFNGENAMLVVCGADAAGTLYGVYDLEHYAIDPAKYKNFPARIFLLNNPFTGEMPEFEVSSSPAVENRGLWTWGHTVYDYRRYLDNMARWKLNTLILWNDHAPVNIGDVCAYARSRGVRIVWAFSCSWGEEVDPTSEAELDKWALRSLETYRVQYAAHGADEIYFQLFTETHDETVEGESIAKLAVRWANAIAAKLLGAYPGLKIQFGLHAMSADVRNNAGLFAGIDPRVNITWEDCGSFPYHYDANITDTHAATLELTRRICSLRGSDEDFGIVVKGMTSLNWSTFEHIRGPFVMGEATRAFIENKVHDKAPYWKYVQANWLRNLGCLTETVRAIRDGSAARVTVTALAEDGGWEDRMWVPVALFAETLWDPDREPEDVLKKVACSSDVAFA